MSSNSLKLIGFILFSIASFGQTTIQQTLDTLSSNEEKLLFIHSEVEKQWYANPKKITAYSKLFDSIAAIVNTPKANGEALNIRGMSMFVNKNYDQAIQNYLAAIREFEAINEFKKLPRIYNNLAVCYKVRDDFKNTEKYYLLALKEATKFKQEKIIAMLNNNLALIYQENKLYDKADKCSLRALAYYKKINDSISIGINYLNNGNSKIETKQYKKAITLYKQAVSYVKQNKFPLIHAVSNTGMGIALTHQKKYKEALPHLLKGVTISKKIKHQEQLLESYNALAAYYATTKNYKNAYELVLKSQKLKDSVLTMQQDKNMVEALAKYESEKKDAQLEILNLENEKSKQQKKWYAYIGLSGLIILIIITLFFYNTNKNKKLLTKKNTQITKALDDYQLLLKETHHRVKNSLQLISSLLYLQAVNIDDKKVAQSVKEGQMRVKSVALIHQKLYQKDSLTGIEISDYILELANDIFQSHQINKNDIALELNVQKMILDIDTVIPIGIIINELIINALKHAFTKQSKNPKITINFKEIENQLFLQVSDNGKGIKEDEKGEQSFGIKLIHSLSRKLKATMNITVDNGTKTVLLIKEYTKK